MGLATLNQALCNAVDSESYWSMDEFVGFGPPNIFYVPTPMYADYHSVSWPLTTPLLALYTYSHINK